MGPKALPVRVRVDERAELGDQPLVPPQRQVRLDALLEDGEAQLLEALGLAGGERLEHDALERPAAPEREGFAEPLSGGGGIVLQAGAPLGRERLEARRVEAARIQAGEVAARRRDDHVGPQGLAQPADVALHHLGRARDRRLAPELVDQPRRRDGLVGVQQEDREQRPLLGRAELQGPPAGRDLERPQDEEIHDRHPLSGGSTAALPRRHRHSTTTAHAGATKGRPLIASPTPRLPKGET